MDLLNLVDGRWIEGSGAALTDTNPARPGEVVARGRLAAPAEVTAAITAAAGAAPAWAATPHHARAAVLAEAARILDGNAEPWGRELSREEGKTLAEGVAEVRGAARILRFYAAESDRDSGEIYPSPRPGESIQVVRKPVGVAGIITPFNFPIAIPAWKIAPALTYGNTVVWKPSSLVPLLALRLAGALADAGLPAGVLNLVYGEGDTGTAIVDHPGVDAVSFTGSTAVGRAIIARCGELAKPVQTEMGGKNASIVLADADLDHAAAQVVAGAYNSTGQKCTATSRLIVHDGVADELLARVADRAAALRVGDPLEEGVQMGPLVSDAARDRVAAGVREAVGEGARPLAGAEPYTDADRAAGWFAPPTLLDLPGTGLGFWRRELFGPVVGAVRARDAAEAFGLANLSDHGLSAAVFTRDLGVALTAVNGLDVGVLHINSESAGTFPWVPFGGVKGSGHGPKEQGRAARDFYTHTVTVYLGPPA
ncbi:aldehyde dehydrogenase family protein [Actinomadura sp. WMMB 499]|uniref:aldehyde dehydrogenase family protein n=1 Tax=Actinomadura sp. WMMB 499 TaxID=1219491 RepID=UPI001245B28D|nr:aldehyde dehydrogenase family protein [Actinomadura sp. WMMB 499]QFG25677.1 aldehyde dehydrogenase family protein [Actinomadura sp. WMMB 499]